MTGPDEGRLANVSAAVLLGGASSRMGRDKARLELAGEPLATRTARLADALFEEVLLVGGDPPPEAPGRRVPDPPGPTCALRGVVAALGAATAPRVWIAATDLPFLSPDLVLGLVAYPAADAVVPRTADGIHPLCAVYRREPALEAAREALAAGQLAIRAALEKLEVTYLEGADLALADPDGRALTNVNTPEDWLRALA